MHQPSQRQSNRSSSPSSFSSGPPAVAAESIGRERYQERAQRRSMSVTSCSCSVNVPSKSKLIAMMVSLLMLTSLISSGSCLCETDFDTMYCDSNTSTGYGFKGKQVWSIDCYPDSLEVIENSEQSFDHGPIEASFSDHEYVYLIRRNDVLLTRDKTLSHIDYKLEIRDLFAGYNSTIKTAFFHNDQVFVYDGHGFSIFNLRASGWRATPTWNFKAPEDWERRISHSKLSNLKSSLTLPAEDGKNSQLVFLLNNKRFYKINGIDYCLLTKSKGELKDLCFWEKGPKKTEALIRCVWISWKVACLIVGISLLAVAVTCYICCLIICYRRKRKSGTFKHEKQNCCSQDGIYFPEDRSSKENGKLHPNGSAKRGPSSHAHNGLNPYHHHEHDFETASSIIDAYDEDQVSIDLREVQYR